MTKHLFAILAMTLLIGLTSAQAKIIRVGYLGTPVAGIDFATFDNNVITAAANGDTIQIYQNNNLNGSAVTINKKLTFLGFGFMLNKNPGLQATALADYSVNLYFSPGSEGSSAQGLNLDVVYVGASNITISRCRITSYLYLGYNYATGQQPAVSNINIYSNFLSGGGVYDYGEVSGLLVSNNIFYSITITLDNATGLFTNNVVTSSGINLNSFIVRNNIISAQCITSSGSVVQNNLFSISSCANVPAGNGNVFSVNLANVFANWNGGSIAADNQLALKAGSPAINAGINGNGTPTDAGVFGGDAGFTYRLSGIPAIPSVYQLSAPSQTASNNPYTITVSVRSNN